MMRLLLILGVMALVALGISLATSDAWNRIESLRAELSVLEKQNTGIRTENRALRRNARLLRSNLDALERVARQEFGLVRPDEQVLHLAPGKHR